MPHSSGGGHSSSSSSRSGSSSHSSGGGSSSSHSQPLILNHASRGYSKYAYYKDHKITYEYLIDEKKLKEDTDLFSIIMTSIFLLITYGAIFWFSIWLFTASIKVIKPLDVNSYDSNITIEDNLDLMTDEQEAKMMNVLETFKSKTGVALCYKTVNDEVWNEDYDSLVDYAYKSYVTSFNDEKHWLIVYSEPNIQQDPKKWSWEGMQGDDTDNVLSGAVSQFNSEYHDKLFRNTNYADAFIETVEDINTLDYNKTDMSNSTFPIIWLIIITIHFLLSLYSSFISPILAKKKLQVKRSEGIKVTKEMIEDICEYCNGIYLHGVHTNCPHCGAPVKIKT